MKTNMILGMVIGIAAVVGCSREKPATSAAVGQPSATSGEVVQVATPPHEPAVVLLRGTSISPTQHQFKMVVHLPAEESPASAAASTATSDGALEAQGTNVSANATAAERPTKSFGVKDGAIVLKQVDLAEEVALADVIALAEVQVMAGRHMDEYLRIKPQLVLKGAFAEGEANAWANFLNPEEGKQYLLFLVRGGKDFTVDAFFPRATEKQIEAVQKALAKPK